MLEDGSYDVFVVDAERAADGDPEASIALDITVLAGPHKGDVLSVRATGLHRDPIDLLGVPATLTVRDGVPSIRLEG